MTNLYRVTIYCRLFDKYLECITDADGAFNVYWLSITSAQGISDEWYIEVMDIMSGTYYDITKGNIYSKNCILGIEENKLIPINKKILYIKDRVEFIKHLEDNNND